MQYNNGHKQQEERRGGAGKWNAVKSMNPHFKRESKVDLSGVADIQKFVDEVSDTEIYDNEERVERIAGISQYVDVISCNFQEQWYPLIHERIPDKLILGTEVYQYFMGDYNQMQNFTNINPVLAAQGCQVQLAVRAFDEEGNPCFRESAKVRFRVEGATRILAVDAGEITGNEPYQGNAVHLFRGQASVMIGFIGEPGKVCVLLTVANWNWREQYG